MVRTETSSSSASSSELIRPRDWRSIMIDKSRLARISLLSHSNPDSGCQPSSRILFSQTQKERWRASMTYQWMIAGSPCPIVEFHDVRTEKFRSNKYLALVEDRLTAPLLVAGGVP